VFSLAPGSGLRGPARRVEFCASLPTRPGAARVPSCGVGETGNDPATPAVGNGEGWGRARAAERRTGFGSDPPGSATTGEARTARLPSAGACDLARGEDQGLRVTASPRYHRPAGFLREKSGPALRRSASWRCCPWTGEPSRVTG